MERPLNGTAQTVKLPVKYNKKSLQQRFDGQITGKMAENARYGVSGCKSQMSGINFFRQN